MKKIIIYIVGFFCGMSITAQNMPYLLKYKVDKNKLYNSQSNGQKGDSTVFHNIKNIYYIDIDSGQHVISFNNHKHEYMPISAIDTVYVYQDEFKCVNNPGTWTEIIYSSEQIYFYKENEQTGHPEALLMIMQNDTILEGNYNYVSYDEDGNPKYINLNGQHFFIEKIYDNYFDALVINPDSSFFYADSIQYVSNGQEALSKHVVNSSNTQSNAQNAISVLDHFIGGTQMVQGSIEILVGCAMLVPGANIAVGATIALVGTATFISGALTTVRATDQLVSDGSHTEGFNIAANVIDAISIFGGKGTIARKIATIALHEGYEASKLILDVNTDMYEAYARAMRMVEGRLTTGRAYLYNIHSNAVMLYGNITRKMNPNDKVGILISDSKDALKIKNCMYSESNETGEFSTLFDDLTPTQEYYYRAYYYATEFDNEYFNPYFVSKVKSFVMPGVKTMNYTPVNNNEYDVRGMIVWNKNNSKHKVGICYSTTNYSPTITDGHSEIDFMEDGTYTIRLNLKDEIYYYRAYAYINDEIVYGETDILTNERLILEKFYNETNGDAWRNNDNWCSDEPLEKWYGIMLDNQNFVSGIHLEDNNLKGSVNLKGLKGLRRIECGNNEIESITVIDCPHFRMNYGDFWANNYKLKSYNIKNCGAYSGQHEDWIGGTSSNIVEIDTIRIDNIIASPGQTFFNELTSKYIEIKNLKDYDRLIFNYVDCDVLCIKNCSFTEYNGVIMQSSGINRIIIDNTLLSYSYEIYNYATYFIIRNTTLGFGEESRKIGYFEGTGEELFDYLFPDGL